MSRVTFLITGLGRGGAETQLVRVGTELVRRGWDVQVITLKDPEESRFISDLQKMGIEIESIHMAGTKDAARLTKLVSVIRRKRPDVLCCFLFHSNIIGTLAGRLARVPKIVISIRSEHFGGGEQRLRMAKLFFPRADVVTINSEATGASMIERRVVAREKLRVVPNAIDVKMFDDTGREQIRDALSFDGFMFLAVGRFDVLKDYPTLLKALKNVNGASLVIAGKDDGTGELQALAASLEISDRVQFLGLRDDIPDLLAACDALVLSSTTEGMPNAVLEAHAAARPVVATDVGGVPEIVSAKSGFVCPPGNIDALADAMQQMVNLPPQKRKEMGEAGRAHVEAVFGIKTIVDEWEDVFTRRNDG